MTSTSTPVITNYILFDDGDDDHHPPPNPTWAWPLLTIQLSLDQQRYDATHMAASDSEPPECPVCLSPFDAGATAPRVLPCGHSLCGPCISSLPPATATNSLRCPLCSQVLPFSRSLGPSSLPKNLTLLSLLPSNPNPKPKPISLPLPPSPPPLPSTQSHVFSRFRHSILPQHASPLRQIPPDPNHLAVGSISADLGAPWLCRQKQSVSLFTIKIAAWQADTAVYRLSYVSRVVAAIDGLSDVAKEELCVVVGVSTRLPRRVCRVYGVWIGPEMAQGPPPRLWLVQERYSRGIVELVGCLERGEEVFRIGVVLMEICEAVMGLHGEGVVLGCFGLNCFCFDLFGHCLIDLNQVLMSCRRIRGASGGSAASGSSSEVEAFVAPEVLAVLNDTRGVKDREIDGVVGCSSDIWSLGCVLVALLTGDEQLVVGWTEGFYDDWKKGVITRLEASLVGTQLEQLGAVTESCLRYDPEDRPKIFDVWRCIRGSLVKSCGDDLAPDDVPVAEKSLRCLLLGELRSTYADPTAAVSSKEVHTSRKGSDIDMARVDGSNGDCIQSEEVDAAGHDEPQFGGALKSVTLRAHRDCITGLAIGGGFLFSSSYDKTINVWSLQDLSRVQSLKGHEHRIMAIVVVDNDYQQLCISGDSGSGIFVWSANSPLKQEPLKKWYEHNDWLYRGVHCLAVSGTGYLYTGSRDKSIKAWSLQDYSLCCTMTGHKSTVSSLAVASGILYSGSWDGTIRSWWLTDHSPLSVLGDDALGSIAPVLSLSAEANFVVSSYENGYLKIWKDDVLVKSEKLHDGAIYALKMDTKWLYTGGWDKVVNIQELSENESAVEIRDVASITCDSIVTSILYWHGKLIVGLSNKEIEVYHKGS